MKFQPLYISIACLLVCGCTASKITTTPVSSTSDVRVINDEFSEYRNHEFDFSIRFPSKIFDNGQHGFSILENTGAYINVRVIENGEVITLARDYVLDWSNPDVEQHSIPVSEDYSVRTPRFKLSYLDDPKYPYQIYVAKVTNDEELRQFVERIYGKGCVLSNSPWSFAGREDTLAYSIEGNAAEGCESVYPLGDVVMWNTKKNVAIGRQPGGTGRIQSVVIDGV
jgi:hypothetical protein